MWFYGQLIRELSFPSNYPKGHGDELKHWLKLNHIRDLLVHIAPTSGSIQDFAIEGDAAVYWNR